MGQDERVAIVADNHPLCKAGLVALVSAFEFDKVISAEDAAHLHRALANYPATIVLLNLNLTGLGGVDGIRRLRMDKPSLRVVVLSHQADRDTVLDVISAGVHGFIPKKFNEEQMRSALDGVLRGQIYVPDVVADLQQERAPGPLKKPGNGEDATGELTSRQREVLALLAKGKSNKEIARILNTSEGTVKVHVNASFRSLGVHNRVSAAAALTALEGKMESRQHRLPWAEE